MCLEIHKKQSRMKYFKLTKMIFSGEKAGMRSEGALPYCLNINENILVFCR